MLKFFRRLGIFFLVAPVLIYLLVIFRGDVILKWPYPFSHIGGAPFQLMVDIILVFIGLILIGISKFLKSRQNHYDKKLL